MSFYRFALATTALCLLVNPASARPLAEVVAGTLNEYPSVNQAKAAVDAAKEQIAIERSEYFPKFSAETAAGRVYGDNATSRGLSTTRGAGYSNMWEGSVSLNQTIFDGLKTQYKVGAARAGKDSAEATLEDVQETLALQTSLSYLNIMRLRHSLEKLQGYQSKIDEYSGRIAAMVKEGASDEAELKQAADTKLQVANLLVVMQGQLRNSEIEFLKLTGQAADADMAKPVLTAAPPEKVEEALNVALSHPRLKRADSDIKAAGLNKDAEEAVLYPTLGAELSSYDKDVDDIIGGEVEDRRALLRLKWDLSTGGAEFARMDKASAELAQSKAAKLDSLRTIEQAIRTAYSDLETAKAQNMIAQSRLQTTQDLKKTYQTQFEGGTVKILQLLNSENQVLNAEVEALNSDYKALAAQYTILASMGVLKQTLMGGQP